MNVSEWRVLRPIRVVVSCALLTVLCLVPRAAMAGVYYPSGVSNGANDIDDLDHAYYYTWVLSGLADDIPTGKNITSASITFYNLRNWNNLANILHLDLLDSGKTGDSSSAGRDEFAGGSGTTGGSAYTSKVMRAADPAFQGTLENPTKNDLNNDALDNTSLTALAYSTTNRISLDDRSFVGPGDSPFGTTTAGPNYNADLKALWDSLKAKGFDPATEIGVVGSFGDGFENTLFSTSSWQITPSGGGYNYTYVFSASEMSTLQSWITNDGTIAIGFDPDCHFDNDGLMFAFTTTSPTAVPEPASLLLLGTGLLAAGRYRNKRRG